MEELSKVSQTERGSRYTTRGRSKFREVEKYGVLEIHLRDSKTTPHGRKALGELRNSPNHQQ